MTKETNIQAEIMMELSKLGCKVWRNNTGALKDKNGRLVRYGLCKGSSDIIGIAPDGRFLAVEVKTDRGRVSDHQRTFLGVVSASGGRAGVARSVEEAVDIALRDW